MKKYIFALAAMIMIYAAPTCRAGLVCINDNPCISTPDAQPRAPQFANQPAPSYVNEWGGKHTFTNNDDGGREVSKEEFESLVRNGHAATMGRSEATLAAFHSELKALPKDAQKEVREEVEHRVKEQEKGITELRQAQNKHMMGVLVSHEGIKKGGEVYVKTKSRKKAGDGWFAVS